MQRKLLQRRLKDIGDIALFVNVIEAGGISRCARVLGYERTTISRRLSRLEESLGVSLLDRTRRKIKFTEAGKRCFDQCSFIVGAVDRAKAAAMNGAAVSATTTVRIGAPAQAFDSFLNEPLSKFQVVNHPMLFDLVPSGSWNSDSMNDVNLGFTLEELPDATSWVKEVACVSEIVCASSSYLEKTGVVASVQKLAEKDLIVDRTMRQRKHWEFSADSEPVTVELNDAFCVASIVEVKEAVLAGLGIGRLPRFMCEKNLQSGELVGVIDDGVVAARPLIMFLPLTATLRLEVIALRDFLDRTLGASRI